MLSWRSLKMAYNGQGYAQCGLESTEINKNKGKPKTFNRVGTIKLNKIK